MVHDARTHPEAYFKTDERTIDRWNLSFLFLLLLLLLHVYCVLPLSSRNELTELRKKNSRREKSQHTSKRRRSLAQSFSSSLRVCVCISLCRCFVGVFRREIINWRIFKSFSFSLQSQWLGAAAAAATAQASRLIVVTLESWTNRIENEINKFVTWLFNKVQHRFSETFFSLSVATSLFSWTLKSVCSNKNVFG